MIDNRKNYLIHPKVIALYILLIGVTSLFIGFSISYIYTRVQSGAPAFKLPPLFILNTFILLASSFTLVRSMKWYREDRTESYKQYLGLTLLLTVLFLLSQIIAWKGLYQDGVFVNHSNMASFLYLISGVHFAHVIVGIPFLAIFYYNAKKKMVEPVSVLIYFSDPEKKRKLKLISVYWHFLDALWIYLVLFFGVNLLF